MVFRKGISIMKKSKKTAIITISVIVVLFIIFNIFWLAYSQVKFKPFKDSVGYSEERQEWYHREEDVVYSISPPSYLSFNGNLSVTDVIKVDENGNLKKDTTCDLIIWLKFGGKIEYGFTIGVKQDDNKSYLNYFFMVDENMNPTKKLAPDAEEVFESNKHIMEDKFKMAKKKWSNLTINL